MDLGGDTSGVQWLSGSGATQGDHVSKFMSIWVSSIQVTKTIHLSSKVKAAAEERNSIPALQGECPEGKKPASSSDSSHDILTSGCLEPSQCVGCGTWD